MLLNVLWVGAMQHEVAGHSRHPFFLCMTLADKEPQLRYAVASSLEQIESVRSHLPPKGALDCDVGLLQLTGGIQDSHRGLVRHTQHLYRLGSSTISAGGFLSESSTTASTCAIRCFSAFQCGTVSIDSVVKQDVTDCQLHKASRP